MEWIKSSFCQAGECVEVAWVKASVCSGDLGCVEVAHMRNETVWVRDSKNPHSPTLIFLRNEWAQFLDGVKRGEFDAPVRGLSSNPTAGIPGPRSGESG